MPGTAAPAPRWLLVEQPGPWGRDALAESRLDSAVTAALRLRARDASVRVQVIRRPGRHDPPVRRRWALVDAEPGQEAVRWGTFADDRELLGLPLTHAELPPAADLPPAVDLPAEGPAGQLPPDEAPILLVCTHGRHDPCCAVRGRPVAAALQATYPEWTWETSHVGGDRFAANLVVLPHGLYYGHVGPQSAVAAVEAFRHGRVLPGLLRGRSAYPSPAQAAQHHVRAERAGYEALDALVLRGLRFRGDHTWEVHLVGPADEWVVTVREEAVSEPARLTCTATRPAAPRGWRLLRLQRAAG